MDLRSGIPQLLPAPAGNATRQQGGCHICCAFPPEPPSPSVHRQRSPQTAHQMSPYLSWGAASAAPPAGSRCHGLMSIEAHTLAQQSACLSLTPHRDLVRLESTPAGKWGGAPLPPGAVHWQAVDHDSNSEALGLLHFQPARVADREHMHRGIGASMPCGLRNTGNNCQCWSFDTAGQSTAKRATVFKECT